MSVDILVLAVPGLQIWSAWSCTSSDSCTGFWFADMKEQLELKVPQQNHGYYVAPNSAPSRGATELTDKAPVLPKPSLNLQSPKRPPSSEKKYWI